MKTLSTIIACVVALVTCVAVAANAAAFTQPDGVKIVPVRGPGGGGGGGHWGGGSMSMGSGHWGGGSWGGGGGSWGGGNWGRGIGSFASPSIHGWTGSAISPHVGAAVGGSLGAGARVARNPGVNLGVRSNAAISGGTTHLPINPGVRANVGANVRSPSGVVGGNVHGNVGGTAGLSHHNHHWGDRDRDDWRRHHGGFYPWWGWNRGYWGYPYYRYRNYPGYYGYSYYPGYYDSGYYSGDYDYGQYATPAVTTVGQVRIVNPAETGATLTFAVDGQQYSLAPGQQQDFNVSAGTTIEFDRGTSQGVAVYSLSPGLYTFAETPQGWELYNQSANAAAQTASPAGSGTGTMY